MNKVYVGVISVCSVCFVMIVIQGILYYNKKLNQPKLEQFVMPQFNVTDKPQINRKIKVEFENIQKVNPLKFRLDRMLRYLRHLSKEPGGQNGTYFTLKQITVLHEIAHIYDHTAWNGTLDDSVTWNYTLDYYCKYCNNQSLTLLNTTMHLYNGIPLQHYIASDWKGTAFTELKVTNFPSCMAKDASRRIYKSFWDRSKMDEISFVHKSTWLFNGDVYQRNQKLLDVG